MISEVVSTPIVICQETENLGDALAVISSVSKENPDAFKRGLLGWLEWSHTQPELEAIAFSPDWDANRLVAELDDERVRLLADMLKQIQTMPLQGGLPNNLMLADGNCLQPHFPEQKLRKRKRYPGKGKACGWIETRRTNRKRENPSEYLVYRWQDGEGKHSRYLKKAIAPQVRAMIADGATIRQILAIIPPRQSKKCKEV